MKSKPQGKTVRCELCACAHTRCSKTAVEIYWNHWFFWIGLRHFEFKMYSATLAPGIPNWRLQDIFYCCATDHAELGEMWSAFNSDVTKIQNHLDTPFLLIHISFLAHVLLFWIDVWLLAFLTLFFQFAQAKQQLPFPRRLRGSRRSSGVKYDPWSIYATLIRFKDFLRGKQSLETIVMLFSYKAFNDRVWGSKMRHADS